MNQPSKAEAKKNEFLGSAQELVGQVSGNEQHKAEGFQQRGRGDAQEFESKALGSGQGITGQVSDAVKDAYETVKEKTMGKSGHGQQEQ